MNDNTSKSGIRKTVHGESQKYICKDCNYQFTPIKVKGKRKPKYCEHCGKEFTRGQLISGNKRYCSTRCRSEARYRTELPPEHKVCINCGNEIVVSPRMRYQLRTKKFCSSACFYEYNKGENHHKHTENIILNCLVCGKEFEVIPSLKDKIKTCRDPSCYKAWMSFKMGGENSPHWRGGISFEPYCPKFNNTFKERVRAFFGYRCVECGELENGEKLSVHHVHYSKDSCCNTEVPRMFVSLCRPCHTKTNHNRKEWQSHFEQLLVSQYGGRSYFTEEEWEKKQNKHLSSC